MRITKIEYENFRNFREHGEIRCSTDGRVTIIYGKNGDGKTTLHQLFQWVFYGQVHFNRTTTDRLYNLQYESECSFHDTFEVMGCIDFEHDGVQYSLKRTHTYRKELNDSEKISEDLVLERMDSDYNWKRVDRPKEIIEKLLPSGLSEYFFFDGESMIADLRVKGRDSANKLRKALYAMFDLDILEAAVGHIGRVDLKTTVLGKLYLSKGTIASSREISAIRTNIVNAQARIESAENDVTAATQRKTELQELINRVSEQIGGHKSKREYERQRRILKGQRDMFLKNAAIAQARFGDIVIDMFPRLLISKAVEDARQRIQLEIEKNKLPDGLTKKLITYLLSKKTAECICGNPLCATERQHIENYLNMLPPKSFTSLYNEFVRTAKSWGNGYDIEPVEECIMSVLENMEQAASCDQQIRELDEEEKKSLDVESLIVARQKAEQEIGELDAKISTKSTDKRKFEIYLKKQMEELDKLTSGNKAAEQVNRKIKLMEQVADYFRKRLSEESYAYSRQLEANIQSLINEMLTSRRTVSVSPEFAVRVMDSFNDESKSEGQFAVISFAYIGGILKMLQGEERLADKEYPLILDGPFSKLDSDQRRNVVTVIPRFAPQVILFSKDDLHDVFDAKDIGRVWTIVSNAEKNVAHVEEGHLWN